MKRVLVVFVAALVVAGVALAAVTQEEAVARPPTTASLMPAYVQAAKYWNGRSRVSATPSPPTTASLMPAYAQAYWLGRAPMSLGIGEQSPRF